MANIKFGTDGWRAILGEDFNQENFENVTNAIAKYVIDSRGFEKVILIGYDPRREADKFAGKCAEILASKGFTVRLSDKIVPTPVLAFQAAKLNACAIMFTASHNPPEYLGMKFIPEYAGPATDDITEQIVKNLGASFPPNKDGGKVIKTDFSEDYIATLANLIDFEKINCAKIPMIFDGFYSATIGYFDRILELWGIPFESMRLAHDSNFGGGMPDPKPKYLAQLIDYCKTHKVVGFANDGDGDRFGVIDENGEYVSPNEIISLLAIHLKTNKNKQGAIAKTVGSSILIEKVAHKLNLPVIETAVGFKHLGQAMRENEVLIAGEESGGLSILGHIPEKDGILANLLILEMMAANKKTLVELRKDLSDWICEKFYTDRVDYKLADRAEINRILEYYKQVSKIDGYMILRKNLIDGVKLYLDESTTILIRPSGTEPLLRVYFEASKLDTIADLKKINFIEV